MKLSKTLPALAAAFLVAAALARALTPAAELQTAAASELSRHAVSAGARMGKWYRAGRTGKSRPERMRANGPGGNAQRDGCRVAFKTGKVRAGKTGTVCASKIGMGFSRLQARV